MTGIFVPCKHDRGESQGVLDKQCRHISITLRRGELQGTVELALGLMDVLEDIFPCPQAVLWVCGFSRAELDVESDSTRVAPDVSRNLKMLFLGSCPSGPSRGDADSETNSIFSVETALAWSRRTGRLEIES